MIHDKEHLLYVAEENEEMYWERVNRSLGWLGNTEEEQKERQKRLKNVVVGIAGTGGIGGTTGAKTSKVGCKKFEVS